MLKKRDLFADPVINKMDQGYLFSGGRSELYVGKNVLGIIITPRCDIAHDKADEIHYLPVVDGSDWKATEFPEIFCTKLQSDTETAIEKKLASMEIPPSIVRQFIPEDVADILGAKNTPDKDVKQILKQIGILRKIADYRKNNDFSVFNQLLLDNVGTRKTIIKDIVEGRSTKYHILECGDTYYFVRLREIKRLQYSFFHRIGGGIHFDDLTDEDRNKNDIADLGQDDMIAPERVLKSPFIEHLVQRFMHGFSRIGVDDIDNKTCDHIINNW